MSEQRADEAPVETPGGDSEVTSSAAEQDALDAELGSEADALWAELQSSQAEVLEMLQAQQDSTQELGDLKSRLTAELEDLQQEAWRLQAYNELETLKQQLAALSELEADLDAAEAVLDAQAAGMGDDAAVEEGGVAAQANTSEVHDVSAEPGASGEGRSSDPASASPADTAVSDRAEDGADDGSLELEDIVRLQAELDVELADMMKQLNTIRNEASTVSAHKARLELELAELLALQVDGSDVDRPEDADQQLNALASPREPGVPTEAAPA